MTKTISKQDYLDLSLAELDLSVQCEGIPACEEFIKSKLRDGFWALDKLERTDVFWHQSNQLPTIHKLYDFAQYQIKAQSNLKCAAWLKIMMDLIHVSQHLEIEAWKILQEHDDIDIPFLVRTAWNTAPYWPDGNVTVFAKLIQALDIAQNIEGELENITNISDDAKQWVQSIQLNRRR